MEIRISTPIGGWYVTDEDGRVLEHSNGLNKRRETKERQETWRITGAWKYIGFGHIKTITLSDLLKECDNLLLKNGQPRYGLTDIDHGTHRYCGNKKYHGVRSIHIIN